MNLLHGVRVQKTSHFFIFLSEMKSGSEPHSRDLWDGQCLSSLGCLPHNSTVSNPRASVGASRGVVLGCLFWEVHPAVTKRSCGSDKDLPMAFKVLFSVMSPRIQVSPYPRGDSFGTLQGRRAQVSRPSGLACCALLVLGAPVLGQGDALLSSVLPPALLSLLLCSDPHLILCSV